MTKYRPEIDGLRAIAILPVVLYHAGVPVFSGGFVGVDVFFVISGYLISSIVMTELDEGRFSFVGFYKRRMRRIFPALFAMLAVSYALAFLLLPPSEMQQFAQSMLASTFFYSNYFFLDHSGYFATAAELTPLLHTWSLAVEEQFYFVFPVLLLVTARLAPALRLGLLAGPAVLSIAVAQYFVMREPAAAFFTLPSRFWELAVGAGAALLHVSQPPWWRRPAAPWHELLPLAGLVLILAAVFLYSGDTPFPGVAALLPVLGAVAIILFAGSSDPVGRLLASPVPVGIGLMSYSLYLWHYPLLAFARRFPFAEGPLALSAVALLSAVLAYLSYRFVETPIRRSARISTLQIYGASIVAMALLAGIGFSGTLSDGYRAFYISYRLDAATKQNFERYSPMAARGENMSTKGDDKACVFRVDTVDDAFISRFDACAKKFGKATVQIGDSHAINVHNALFDAGVSPFFVSVAQGGCRPYQTRERCGYERFVDFAAARKAEISGIIFHLSGSHMILDHLGREDNQAAFVSGNSWAFSEKAIAGVPAYLGRLPRDIPITWLGPFAEARLDLKEPGNYSPDKLRFSAASLEIFARLDARLKQVAAASPGYRYISAVDGLGFGRDSLVEDGCLTFQDVDHFSDCGEKRFGPVLARLLGLK